MRDEELALKHGTTAYPPVARKNNLGPARRDALTEIKCDKLEILAVLDSTNSLRLIGSGFRAMRQSIQHYDVIANGT